MVMSLVKLLISAALVLLIFSQLVEVSLSHMYEEGVLPDAL